MSSISLPVFEEKERLAHQKLNAAMQAIEARFDVGIGAAQLTWPMTADGNLDMGAHNILGGKQIWNIVNAAEYDDLNDAVAAAGSNGIVYIPNGTTATCASAITLPSGCAIIGAGRSSVIRRTDEGACLSITSNYNILSNLRVQGGGAGVGVTCANTQNTLFNRVWFEGITTRQVSVADGSNVEFKGCYFFAGADQDCAYLTGGSATFNDCVFDKSGAGVSILVTSTSTTKLRVVSGLFLGATAVNVNSMGAVGSSAVWLDKCDCTTANLVIGDSSTTRVGEVHITDCRANSMEINASSGSVCGNILSIASGTAIQLHKSIGLVVTGNKIATPAYGVDINDPDCTTCIICNNNLDGAATSAFNDTDASGTHIIKNNLGQVAASSSGAERGIINAAEYDNLNDAVTAAGSYGVVYIPDNTTMQCTSTITLPAGCVIRGAGYSSVITRTGSGACLTLTSNHHSIANVRIHGDGGGTGVDITNAANIMFNTVWFTGVTTRHVAIAGIASAVEFKNCYFFADVAGQNGILVNGGSHRVNDCVFDVSNTSVPIKVTSSVAFRIWVSDVYFFGGTTAIEVDSTGAVSGSDLFIRGCKCNSADMVIGVDSSIKVGEVHITDCSMVRLQVNASSGNVHGNVFSATTGTALQLHRSSNLVISGNVVGAVAYGVDVSNVACTNCIIHDNILAAATTAALKETGGSFTHVIRDNTGQVIHRPYGDTIAFIGHYPSALWELSSVGHAGYAETAIELPNVLQVGSVLRIRLQGAMCWLVSGTTPNSAVGLGAGSATLDIGYMTMGASNWTAHIYDIVLTVVSKSGSTGTVSYVSTSSRNLATGGTATPGRHRSGQYANVQLSPLFLYFKVDGSNKLARVEQVLVTFHKAHTIVASL